MKKFFCDRCGKDVTSQRTSAISGVRDADEAGDGEATDCLDHLCRRCYALIWKFIRGDRT